MLKNSEPEVHLEGSPEITAQDSNGLFFRVIEVTTQAVATETLWADFRSLCDSVAWKADESMTFQ